MKPQIAVKNLSVWYGDYCALEEISFEAAEGEFVAIVGKSGSGKSTLLDALSQFIPYGGEVIIPPKIGVIFQGNSVFSWMTVSQNIGFGLEKYSSEKQGQILANHLRLTGLENEKDRYPAELSGGQIQRVALARSLARNPEVLLMDEPYGALDTHTRGKMQQWLLDVWSKHKKTIIFVTHDIEEAVFLTDRIMILDHGKFIAELEVPFERPRKESVKFSPQFNELKQKIARLINAH